MDHGAGCFLFERGPLEGGLQSDGGGGGVDVGGGVVEPVGADVGGRRGQGGGEGEDGADWKNGFHGILLASKENSVLGTGMQPRNRDRLIPQF